MTAASDGVGCGRGSVRVDVNRRTGLVMLRIQRKGGSGCADRAVVGKSEERARIWDDSWITAAVNKLWGE